MNDLDDDMKTEYDFSRAERGKHYAGADAVFQIGGGENAEPAAGGSKPLSSPPGRTPENSGATPQPSAARTGK